MPLPYPSRSYRLESYNRKVEIRELHNQVEQLLTDSPLWSPTDDREFRDLRPTGRFNAAFANSLITLANQLCDGQRFILQELAEALVDTPLCAQDKLAYYLIPTAQSMREDRLRAVINVRTILTHSHRMAPCGVLQGWWPDEISWVPGALVRPVEDGGFDRFKHDRDWENCWLRPWTDALPDLRQDVFKRAVDRLKDVYSVDARMPE